MADPSLGPVQLLKVDLSDGFYRVNLNVDGISKLGVVYHTNPGEEHLIVFLLVLTMRWRNSPPIFSTATETITNLTNQQIQTDLIHCPHPLNIKADDNEVVPIDPLYPHMPSNQLPKPILSPEAPVFRMSVMPPASSTPLT